MPALTSALTCAGNDAANWPSLNIVARSPFCRSALRMAGVWSLEGPSSNVSPTYPLQVAACDGVATTVTATVLAVALRATASPATKERLIRIAFLRPQPALQETVGQVWLPLCWMVTPQLLPLPLGLATRVWALG